MRRSPLGRSRLTCWLSLAMRERIPLLVAHAVGTPMATTPRAWRSRVVRGTAGVSPLYAAGTRLRSPPARGPCASPAGGGSGRCQRSPGPLSLCSHPMAGATPSPLPPRWRRGLGGLWRSRHGERGQGPLSLPAGSWGPCVLPAALGATRAFMARREALSSLTPSLPEVRTNPGPGASSFWGIDFPPFCFPVQPQPRNLSQPRGFAQYRYCRKRS